MHYRTLGKSGFKVSEIGLGCWQLGNDFGPVEDAEAAAILESAQGQGVSFFDTADVYGSHVLVSGSSSRHRRLWSLPKLDVMLSSILMVTLKRQSRRVCRARLSASVSSVSISRSCTVCPLRFCLTEKFLAGWKTFSRRG